jgi:hypothetical protein
VETTAAVEATTTKSTAMEAAAAKSTAVEATTTAHAVSATAAHAASMSTTTAAAAASVTAATTATAAASECRSWLNQADRCQREQGYNRFSHYAFPPLDERSLLGIQHFRSGIIRRSDSVCSKLTVRRVPPEIRICDRRPAKLTQSCRPFRTSSDYPFGALPPLLADLSKPQSI